MPSQACPNCQRLHDVGIFVSGQKVRCLCGISFEVKRSDVSLVGVRVNKVSPTVPGRTPRQTPGFSGSVALAVVESSPLEKTHVRAGAANELVVGARNTVVAAPAPEIPGYDLLEVLGRGGMGEVWRAVQKSLGRTVAVKLLPERLAADPEFVKRFEKEATALASLSHPNIIQIIDRGVAGSHYYFAMEFVAGRSLREVMGHSQMASADALKICLQICRAVESAHDKGIIHRDLKPENILVDERGHVKVADFGLAGIRGPEAKEEHLTATSVAMGTVNYMAPEQRRDARNVDGRADLYSLGVMLYELLTGELPIGRFKLPSQKLPGLDGRVDAVVERLLEPEASARYATAAECGAALEAIVGSGVTPVPVGSAIRAASSASTGAPGEKNPSVIQSGMRSARLFLTVVGGLALLGALTNFVFGKSELFTVETKGGKKVTVGTGGIELDGTQAKRQPFPANTYDDLYSGIKVAEAGPGREQVEVLFTDGEEKLNAHSGTWELKDELLTSVQAGNETNGNKLIPRAYVAHRYFNADDFVAETDLRLRSVDDIYAVEPEAQRFGELAFRIKDLQVSIFAIRGTGMRLLWRYFTPDGVEQTGNSAKDLELMVEDEMPAPEDGQWVHLKLQLHRVKSGVEVEAFANNQRFARKTLVGLDGQVGKLAVGCRNLSCAFRNLKVAGKVEARPAPRAAQ